MLPAVPSEMLASVPVADIVRAPAAAVTAAVGALMATVGLEAIRFAFVWYVKNFGQYNLVYGPIGTVIALLMFIYLTAWVLLFFAKFSYVKMRRDSEGLLIAGTSPPPVA